MTWTVEMDITMEKEYPRYSAAELADVFGKSAQAVRARAWLPGITGQCKSRGDRFYDEAFLDKILAEYASRKPADIARDYNMTRDQVWWLIRRAQTYGR